MARRHPDIGVCADKDDWNLNIGLHVLVADFSLATFPQAVAFSPS